MTYDVCHTCGERGRCVPFEGGKVWSYACTAEIVVTDQGQATTIKACPDWNRMSKVRGGG
jgi:hypothetical protein